MRLLPRCALPGLPQGRQVTGNPKASAWYSTPNAKRRRKGVELTLSDEAREKLKRLAKKRGVSMSAVVEELIREAK